METNSKKVLAALPSFEDYMQLAEEVKELSLKKMKLENLIKNRESSIFLETQQNSEYWKSGKPVSVSYFEIAYKYPGINGDMLSIRNEYAEIIAELDSKKLQFEIYKQMHDLYKALAYQEKAMS